MKYTAHLAGGGIVNLEFRNGTSTSRVTAKDSWLVDDNGVMVNMTHCAALVPDLAPAEKEIDFDGATFIDRDGDRWYRADDGRYRIGDQQFGGGGFTKEYIERSYGPLRYPSH